MSKRKSTPKRLQAIIFTRDKWCCRYCGIEVFFSPALKALEALSPNHGYYHKNGRKDKMSKLLLDRCGAIDHINPITRGGENKIDNLICACWKCNTKKGNDEPSIWIDRIIPIEDLAVADNWDGFLSLLRQLDPTNEWFKYFD